MSAERRLVAILAIHTTYDVAETCPIMSSRAFKKLYLNEPEKVEDEVDEEEEIVIQKTSNAFDMVSSNML